ncbi:MAG: sigma-70 family RNA polymerase sigma factor, partial [Acidobacteriales bacterium]|nr:sigma-70 family RNA polymerase sigma factor [Terriglobales bacterium]
MTTTAKAGCRIPAALAAELCEKSSASKYGIKASAFVLILEQVAAKYLPAAANQAEVRELCVGLRVEELALARGCALGNDQAWEVFLTRYRATLYDSARGIVRDEARAKELADSLYADLYGLKVNGSGRASKLASYMGRGSLAGWLRTVLAQEYVNRYRAARRLVSLEEQTEAGVQFPAKAPEPLAAPASGQGLEAATDAALAALPPEEKFILAAYYLDERTLAEIARALGVHESTVCRKLEKAAKGLRRA